MEVAYPQPGWTAITDAIDMGDPVSRSPDPWAYLLSEELTAIEFPDGAEIEFYFQASVSSDFPENVEGMILTKEFYAGPMKANVNDGTWFKNVNRQNAQYLGPVKACCTHNLLAELRYVRVICINRGATIEAGQTFSFNRINTSPS